VAQRGRASGERASSVGGSNAPQLECRGELGVSYCHPGRVSGVGLKCPQLWHALYSRALSGRMRGEAGASLNGICASAGLTARHLRAARCALRAVRE
jgi:hypothetical protein